MSKRRVLYCHCAYSKVIAEQVKTKVLEGLAESDEAFEAVADLCEMSARKDPALERLAANDGELRIAACYPRAVNWLFSAAGCPLPKNSVSIRNMRTETPEQVLDGLLSDSPAPPPSDDDEPEAPPEKRGEANLRPFDANKQLESKAGADDSKETSE
ncbi:MAG: hypothetical protein AAF517_03315 [Planctomycetota bacterium]